MSKYFLSDYVVPDVCYTATIDDFIYVAEGVTVGSTLNNALRSLSEHTILEILGNVNSFTALNTITLGNNTGSDGNFHINIGKSGSIFGQYTAIIIDDAENSIYNDGNIISINTEAVKSFGDKFELSNNGTITSHLGDAVFSSGANSSIVNYGLIQSIGSNLLAYGVNLYYSGPGTAVTLTNFGTISAAGGIAVVGDTDGVDRITNFGTFNGDVEQQGGNDFFRNGGNVLGDIDLGTGMDLFKGWGGTVDGTIHGGGGNDTIYGGLSDDAIFGDAGADVLKGGSGDDTLIGGPGHDFLKGGPGSDTFGFKALADSAANAQRDRILDFHHGEDVIDISSIDAKAGVNGNQAFHFIGAADFSGTTKGDLHAVNSGANTLVEGDTNGDGTANFSILVIGVHGLTTGDFIL